MTIEWILFRAIRLRLFLWNLAVGIHNCLTISAVLLIKFEFASAKPVETEVEVRVNLTRQHLSPSFKSIPPCPSSGLNHLTLFHNMIALNTQI